VATYQELELKIEGHTLLALSFNPEQKGPPIILLHGIIASVHFWSDDLLAPFLKSGPCYALSLPGHYPAAFPKDFAVADLTAESLARLLTAAIRQIAGQQPVILVGHSTGAFAALNIAARTPELIRKVISISGFTHGKWSGVLGVAQWFARRGRLGRAAFNIFFWFVCWKIIYHLAWRFFVNDSARLTNYPNIKAIIQESFLPFTHLLPSDVIKYFIAMPEIDITGLLQQIRVPTFAMTGDCDPIVPPEQAYLVVRQVAAANLAVIRDAGHFPFYEKPHEYQEAIAEWLNMGVERDVPEERKIA
jgi:pimeloyl-ACP methyl ester carboxylesterase